MADFDISLGANSSDARVVVNGHDVTESVRTITIQQSAGELPRVTIEIIGTSGSVHLAAALELDRLALERRIVEMTALGVETEAKAAL